MDTVGGHSGVQSSPYNNSWDTPRAMGYEGVWPLRNDQKKVSEKSGKIRNKLYDNYWVIKN